MISSTRVDNQELTVRPERPRIQDRAIARRYDLGARARFDVNSLGSRAIAARFPELYQQLPCTGIGRSPCEFPKAMVAAIRPGCGGASLNRRGIAASCFSAAALALLGRGIQDWEAFLPELLMLARLIWLAFFRFSRVSSAHFELLAIFDQAANRFATSSRRLGLLRFAPLLLQLGVFLGGRAGSPPRLSAWQASRHPQ